MVIGKIVLIEGFNMALIDLSQWNITTYFAISSNHHGKTCNKANQNNVLQVYA